MAFDRTLIDRYEAGGELLGKAIRGLTTQDFLAAPPPGENIGKWTIQQVVVHLTDDEMVWIDRMKRIIAEDNPPLIGFDESKYIANLHPETQDLAVAQQIFELSRREFAKILRALPNSAFDRTGNHSERGPITLGESVKIISEHLDHHLKFVHAKRAAMGKETS